MHPSVYTTRITTVMAVLYILMHNCILQPAAHICHNKALWAQFTYLQVMSSRWSRWLLWCTVEWWLRQMPVNNIVLYGCPSRSFLVWLNNSYSILFFYGSSFHLHCNILSGKTYSLQGVSTDCCGETLCWFCCWTRTHTMTFMCQCLQMVLYLQQ